MKKLLLMICIVGLISQPVNAVLKYDPVQNILYSYPKHPSINPVEYVGLFVACIELSNRIVAMNSGRQVPIKEELEQIFVFLKSVGTPTALRLIEDIKANAIYYENGTFMRKLY